MATNSVHISTALSIGLKILPAFKHEKRSLSTLQSCTQTSTQSHTSALSERAPLTFIRGTGPLFCLQIISRNIRGHRQVLDSGGDVAIMARRQGAVRILRLEYLQRPYNHFTWHDCTLCTSTNLSKPCRWIRWASNPSQLIASQSIPQPG